MRFLDVLRQAADPLVYTAILLVFAVGIIRCVAPVAANRRQILRGIRRVRSASTRNDWQEDAFLGKGSLLPHWEAYLKNLFFADGVYHDASSVEDFINEETVIQGPGRSAFAEGVPGLLVSLGFMGTLIGLVNGLSDFSMTDSAAVQQSIVTLVPGMRYAFLTSIAGVVASVTFSVLVRWVNGSTEKSIREFYSAMTRYAGVESVDPLTQIATYQQEQTAMLRTVAKDMNGHMTENLAQALREAVSPLQETLKEFVAVNTAEQMRFLDTVTQRFVDRMEQALSGSLRTLGSTIDQIAVKEAQAFAQTEEAYREVRRIMEETRDIHAEMKAVSEEWKKVFPGIRTAQEDIAAAGSSLARETQSSVAALVNQTEKLSLVSDRESACLVSLAMAAEKLEKASDELHAARGEDTEREEAFRRELLNAIWDVRDDLYDALRGRDEPAAQNGEGE